MYNLVKHFKDWRRHKKAEKEMASIIKLAKEKGVLPYNGRPASDCDKEFLDEHWEAFRQASIIWMDYERKRRHK